MAKKGSIKSKTEIDGSAKVLEDILVQLETLTERQKKAASELHQLKKQFKAMEPCRCCKEAGSKKAKSKNRKSRKSAKNKAKALVSHIDGVEVAKKSKNAANDSGSKSVAAGERVSDDLKWIAGVGPTLEKTLNELGVFKFDQIANWTQRQVDEVNEQLKFSGRIERDNWIEQAKALAEGGWEKYVKVFGKEPR